MRRFSGCNPQSGDADVHFPIQLVLAAGITSDNYPGSLFVQTTLRGRNSPTLLTSATKTRGASCLTDEKRSIPSSFFSALACSAPTTSKKNRCRHSQPPQQPGTDNPGARLRGHVLVARKMARR